MNQIEPLLSIIVPVYNAELYLKRCVRSIQNQLWKNFELILVDDGSSDQSGILCDQLSKEDRRIRVIHKKKRWGSICSECRFRYCIRRLYRFCRF